MKYYSCEYANFLCGIGVEKGKEYLIQQLKTEFAFYYNIYEINEIFSCRARIYIVDEAFTGIIEKNEECIHSSHSKNDKILIDGTLYTQQDARIYACVKKEEDRIYYYIKKTKTKILVNIQEKTIFISGGNLYNMLVYVYETLLSISIENQKGIHLHGACVQWNNKGYIITGKSGGGKTTMLFNALKCGGKFHSNDRVAIFLEGEKVKAYSIPIPVNVSVNMMRTLEEWKNTELVKNAQENTKIRFSVAQLDRIFQNNRITTTYVDMIVVVDYSENEPEYKIINKNQIKENLDVLSPYDENHPKWLPVFEYPDEIEIGNNLEEIGKKIVVCKVSGRNIFETFMKENINGDYIW